MHERLLRRHHKLLLDAILTIENSQDIEVILSQIDVVHENCEVLLDFKTQGLPAYLKSPSDVMSQIDVVKLCVAENESEVAAFIARSKTEGFNAGSCEVGRYVMSIGRLHKMVDAMFDEPKLDRL